MLGRIDWKLCGKFLEESFENTWMNNLENYRNNLWKKKSEEVIKGFLDEFLNEFFKIFYRNSYVFKDSWRNLCEDFRGILRWNFGYFSGSFPKGFFVKAWRCLKGCIRINPCICYWNYCLAKSLKRHWEESFEKRNQEETQEKFL